jgi:hypothetical protein
VPLVGSAIYATEKRGDLVAYPPPPHYPAATVSSTVGAFSAKALRTIVAMSRAAVAIPS